MPRPACAAVAFLLIIQTATAALAAPNTADGGRLIEVSQPITVQGLAPPACDGLGLTNLVTASEGSGQRIGGTNGNDLVLGTAGTDILDGRAGDDCLVGGAGADDLDGSADEDVCLVDGPTDTTRRCETVTTSDPSESAGPDT